MGKTKAEPYVIPLLAALDFIKCAQRATGTDTQRHCMLSMHTATAFDGLIAAGMSIAEELQCCPQTFRLIAALSSCSPGHSLTHVAIDRLLVQSGEFQAYVPLYSPAEMKWALPDSKQVLADNRIKAALKCAASVVSDTAQLLHESAVMLQAQTCIGTNGSVIIEAFHGWDLPSALLPKAAVKAILGTKKELVGIGYGMETVTFWFEDNSWIRTQRYLADYPDAGKLLNTPVNLIPFPIGLISAVHQLAPHSEDGHVYCADGKASSHPFGRTDSFNARMTLDVSGINDSRIYRIANIDVIEKYVQRFDDQAMYKRTFFYGAADVKLGARKSQTVNVRVRGAMTHDTETAQPIDPNAPVAIGYGRQPSSGELRTGAQTSWPNNSCGHLHFVAGCNGCDDDIPF